MSEANMKVDVDQTSSAKHFDGENFDGGQVLLVQAKTNVIEALRNDNGEAARNFLGAALHTLQDFYSHTNWVELGNFDINFDLGKSGVRLSLVTFGKQTCSACGFGGIDRIWGVATTVPLTQTGSICSPVVTTREKTFLPRWRYLTGNAVTKSCCGFHL
jgi:hypothetical protein